MISIALTKGRIEKELVKVLEKSNFSVDELKDKGRKLVFNDNLNDIRYFLVKANDTVTYVEHGVADIAVVGKDTLLEREGDYYELLDLKIGKCKFIVATLPNIDIFKKIGHIKIGTKYPKVAKRYFESKGMDVEIIKIEGSVELSPILGISEGIVDIMETGITLKENGFLKVPIMTDCLRPDLAILDPEITMTMPDHVAAETGMDALTHAIEAYTNHNLDDFDEGLCSSAIIGIMKWLPVSVFDKTLEAREKVHNYQAMAGIGFANVGLGMVHGIAHSFGAAYNMAHGLTNAIILPYVLRYNSRDAVVREKLAELSYRCHCDDIITEIEKMREKLGIPASFREAGITEEMYREKYDLLLEHAMLGATNVNPVKMTIEEMKKMLNVVYTGNWEI